MFSTCHTCSRGSVYKWRMGIEWKLCISCCTRLLCNGDLGVRRNAGSFPSRGDTVGCAWELVEERSLSPYSRPQLLVGELPHAELGGEWVTE